MKIFLIALLCVLPCLLCKSGSGNTPPVFAPMSVPAEPRKKTEAEAHREYYAAAQQAPKAKETGAVQDLMEPELLALLLLIMLLGMIYAGPTR